MLNLVIETVEVSSRDGVHKKINEYLSLGWIVLETWVVGYGDPKERMETLHALLGLIYRTADPKHPDSIDDAESLRQSK